MKNIFADKATLIARKMLKYPDRHWVVRDFAGAEGLSLGMAQGVLDTMEKKGYIERVKKGPASYSILTNKDRLVSDWLQEYRLDFNEVYTYYNPDKYILKNFRQHLTEGQYAFTLHTGANFITSFVRSEAIFVYLNLQQWEKELSQIRQKLDLKELVRGGNIHIIKPFYKHSVFFDTQKIKGYNIVSNLQLYLDLYHFQPRGIEHAEYLKQMIEEKGGRFD